MKNKFSTFHFQFSIFKLLPKAQNDGKWVALIIDEEREREVSSDTVGVILERSEGSGRNGNPDEIGF